MDGEKSDRIKSLNQSETEVLHYLFKDPNFRVIEVARELYRGEGGVRTNLTAIFNKLGVPKDVFNKREWVVREYSEAYKEVFQREPEIYIKPPDPVLAGSPEAIPENSVLIDKDELRRLRDRPGNCAQVFIVFLFLLIGFIIGIFLEYYYYI